MRKILLIICFGLLNLSAGMCKTYYDSMNDTIQKVTKANKLGMTKERDSQVGILVYYTNQTVLNCHSSSDYFKRAMKIKKLNDKMGLK